MSHRNHLWVDPQTLRSLLEGTGVELLSPPPPLVKELVVVNQIEVRGGLPPFFTSSEDRLDQTLDVFVEELAEVSGCDAVFVADDQGLLLAGHGDESLVAGTAVIDRALRSAREALDLDLGTSLVLELAEHRFAQMIWVDGPNEKVVVGLLVNKALGPDFANAIRTTLTRLLEESCDQGEQ